MIHPFSDLAVNREEGCTVVARGDGAYIFHSDGNQFIDGIGGLWCVNIGYGREEMIDAILRESIRATQGDLVKEGLWS